MKTLVLAASAAALVSTSASAELLLQLDLSVVDQVTITATTGNSSATVNFSDGIGFYMADAFDDAAAGTGDTLVAGDLTTAADTSDGSPDLFSFGGSFGLNVFSDSSTDPSDVVAGAQAFSGSGTWTISSASYASLVAGPQGGSVWANADSDDDLLAGGSGTNIGEWNVIPEPGSLALLGLGGLAMLRRRR